MIFKNYFQPLEGSEKEPYLLTQDDIAAYLSKFRSEDPFALKTLQELENLKILKKLIRNTKVYDFFNWIKNNRTVLGNFLNSIEIDLDTHGQTLAVVSVIEIIDYLLEEQKYSQMPDVQLEA